ncbi:sterile alpha motif domain-containing protein 7 [Trichosurus vulpecula]|uniref:sterile alpha motif domain-containing protein 7 n=1 Tax=Trichosurus vulpecula TaxID=9337 RepID=UPI00186AD136|nr:sterile alpha motif domain-containing protein 7 [Trichosurus vulpecula]
MRNPVMTVNPPLIGSGPQRIQSVPPQFEARFMDRDSLPSVDMMAPPDPRQIHIPSRLGASVPPHVNMPHILSNTVYPGYSFLQPESVEAVARRQELVQKQNLVRSSKNQEEDRNSDQTLTISAAEKEDKKDLDIEPHPKYEPSQSDGEPTIMPTKSFKEHKHSPPKPCEEHDWSIETNNSGGTSDLFLNGEDLSSVEDIRKWAVDDVYDFITGLPGCSDYAQIFRDHAIDGETLPLLTEEHLLDTMGLKLGPALKIRSQVSGILWQHLVLSLCGKGSVFE